LQERHLFFFFFPSLRLGSASSEEDGIADPDTSRLSTEHDDEDETSEAAEADAPNVERSEAERCEKTTIH
jgi:hypothetical protein